MRTVIIIGCILIVGAINQEMINENAKIFARLIYGALLLDFYVEFIRGGRKK